ncbi:MAG: cytochrome c [Alphaproteobacteria bacterium]|nr:cytochrome c [Alphaproteobacteria bacterium]
MQHEVSHDLPKYLTLAVLAAGLGIFVWQLPAPSGTSKGPTVAVKVPALSMLAINGKTAFDANCATCHGLNAAGTSTIRGTMLMAPFFLRPSLGVRQHHWPYGDMPPQRHVTEPQVATIVQYIRELQVANGIRYRPHLM